MTTQPIYILLKLFYLLDRPSFLFISVLGVLAFYLDLDDSLIPQYFYLFHILCLLSTDLLIFLFCDAVRSSTSLFSHLYSISFHIQLALFLSFHLISLLSLSLISSFVHLLVSCFCETHIKANSRVCVLQPHASVFSSLFHSAHAVIFHSACLVSFAALIISLFCNYFLLNLSLVVIFSLSVSTKFFCIFIRWPTQVLHCTFPVSYPVFFFNMPALSFLFLSHFPAPLLTASTGAQITGKACYTPQKTKHLSSSHSLVCFLIFFHNVPSSAHFQKSFIGL